MSGLTDGNVKVAQKNQEHEMYFKNVDHQMKGMRSRSLNLSSGLKSQHPCR